MGAVICYAIVTISQLPIATQKYNKSPNTQRILELFYWLDYN